MEKTKEERVQGFTAAAIVDIIERVSNGDLVGPTWLEAQHSACTALGLWAWIKDPEVIDLVQLAAEAMMRAESALWICHLVSWSQHNILPNLDEVQREEFSEFAQDLPIACLEGRGMFAEDAMQMWADIAGVELPQT